MILSLEMHCKRRGQEMIAAILKKHLGDALLLYEELDGMDDVSPAALPVTTVRQKVMAARQICRSLATSAPIQDASVRPWTIRATRELVRWPRTNAIPTGIGLP